MSDTPRTDAARAAHKSMWESGGKGFVPNGWAFAEQLERELAEANQRASSWQTKCEYAKMNAEASATEVGGRPDEPRVVLTFCGLLVPDDSPLLKDKEWLAEAVGARSENAENPENPLLCLSVHPLLWDQEAVDFIKRRNRMNNSAA